MAEEKQASETRKKRHSFVCHVGFCLHNDHMFGSSYQSYQCVITVYFFLFLFISVTKQVKNNNLQTLHNIWMEFFCLHRLFMRCLWTLKHHKPIQLFSISVISHAPGLLLSYSIKQLCNNFLFGLFVFILLSIVIT